jgi:hypothetical protein
MTTHGKYSDSGDEPHYLIVAESLLSDGDLNLANNFAEDDARWFGANGLEHGPHARINQRGALWSSHDIGVPILVLPIYAIATRLAAHVPEPLLARFRQTQGLFAYSLVSLTLLLLTSASIALFVSGIARHTSSRRALVLGLVFALSPPVMSHAFLVFPETIAFMVVCAAAWLLLVRESEVTITRVMLVVAGVGLLPWLHRKYSFFSPALVALVLHQHRAWLRRSGAGVRWTLAALTLAPQAVLHLWTFNAWGNVGGPQMLTAVPLSLTGIPRGALGLLFDRERGLLGYSPVYWLLPTFWVLAWRCSRRLLLPIGMLFVPMAMFVDWPAGFSPAARYLVPLMPLLVLPAVRAIDHALVRRVAMPLLLGQGIIVAALWQNPRALWPREVGTNPVLERIPVIGPAYQALLPSLAAGDPVVWGLGCAVLLVVLTVGLIFMGSDRGQTSL